MAHAPDRAPLDRDATAAGAVAAGQTRVGGYLLERPIASGTSGIVYRASTSSSGAAWR